MTGVGNNPDWNARPAAPGGGAIDYWGAPVPNFYGERLPPIPRADAALGWAAAHSAHARDAALNAHDAVNDLTAKVASLTELVTALSGKLDQVLADVSPADVSPPPVPDAPAPAQAAPVVDPFSWTSAPVASPPLSVSPVDGLQPTSSPTPPPVQ